MKIGDQIKGFEVIGINDLPLLSNKMIQLAHLKTGARMIHMANDDTNNCFSIGFKTTPQDSTGVAHILEHTALCGSRRFPVRDPFFSMIKRSMKTFMNAMTANDWTMYPFATQNKKDYFNLLDIYLDAVFHPILSKNSFMQEGHRLEFEDPGNPESELIPQGIVYSEMKGAMSSQSHIMHRSMGAALYPTTTYRFNSGGEPEDIIDLTHEQLLDFHKSYYHPSNSFLFTYGDIPIEERLEFINQILDPFDRLNVDSQVPEEARFTQPQSFDFHYPLNQSENNGERSQFAIGWLTCNIQEPIEVLSLQLINLILLGHAGAPLRKALLESNLGKSLADTTGFDEEFKEPYFSVGLQGVKKEDMPKIQTLIEKTLLEVVKEGILQEQVDSAIHQIEMDTKEISGGHYPYSLDLLFRFFGTWIHDGDPLSAIDFDTNLSFIKNKIKTERYLENQIQKYLIDNPHKIILRLFPDGEMEAKQARSLKDKMSKIKQKLTPEQKKEIISASESLKTLQELKEDISCLPSLTVSDIPKDIRHMPAHPKSDEAPNVTYYDCPTNGIVYVNWQFKSGQIAESDRASLPLLGSILPNIGLKGVSYEEMAKVTSRFTGGYSASPGLEIDINQRGKYHEYLILKSKALEANTEKMFDLATQFLTEVDFSDIPRIQTLIGQRTNALLNSIVQAGHSYASSLASRDLSATSQIAEVYSGIHQIQYMRDLADSNPEKLPELMSRFRTLLHELINPENLSVVIVGEEKTFRQAEQALGKMKESLSKIQSRKDDAGDDPSAFLPQFHNEAWTTTTPVSYVAKCFKTPEYSHPDSPVLLVLANLIRSNYLHGEIREKGGAYGGMASYNSDEGIFSMLSYRDPHLARTIDVFNQALTWVEKGDFEQLDVDEVILQTCSNIDTPLSPAGKAMSEYLAERKGKTKAMRERFREGILACDKESIIRVARQYLTSTASLAAVTSEEIIKRDESALTPYQLAFNQI